MNHSKRTTVSHKQFKRFSGQEPESYSARQLHTTNQDGVPGLPPKTWNGISAYANPDEDTMRPVLLALKEPTAAEEARMAALVMKAVSRA